MRYVALSGREITAETWLLWSRDRSVCRRKFDKVAEHRWVETSWVGVWLPSFEPRPLPFCVRVCYGDDCRDGWSWHATEGAALEAHMKALAKLRGQTQ